MIVAGIETNPKSEQFGYWPLQTKAKIQINH